MPALRPFAFAALAAAGLLCGTAGSAQPNLAPELDRFAADVAERNQLDVKQLRQWLAEARHQPSIIEAITRPAEALPWHRYRPIFLTEERIAQGAAFWNENAEMLERISREYGVPAQILVAIVGVETYYGRFKGKHRVLDALYTLGFDYPPRASFFQRELEQYLLLVQEERMDPLELTGSYAGAMGMPQFIASSYRSYAVDGDDDGRRDLFSSKADVLASVANYFKRHGWKAGEPVLFPAKVSGERWQPLVVKPLKPAHTVGELHAAGVASAAPDAEAAARLLVLDGAKGDEYWLTLNNFYVITRYNHSPLYAMAVYQLSEEVRARREARQ